MKNRGIKKVSKYSRVLNSIQIVLINIKNKFLHYDRNRTQREKFKYNIKGYRDKARARGVANRFNKMYKKICYFCEKKSEELHHPDYDKPELVIPLCIKCHKKLHVITNRREVK